LRRCRRDRHPHRGHLRREATAGSLHDGDRGRDDRVELVLHVALGGDQRFAALLSSRLWA
jgi:hypothetical protein